MRATLLRRGDTGPRVAAVRSQLGAAGVDVPVPSAGTTVFDEGLEQAVREFQQRRGLRADGIVGPETSRALDAARWTLGDRILRYVPGHLVVGDDVIELQERLLQLGVFSGRVDGVLGPETEHALRELQRASGVAADGTCGPATLRVLSRLVRTVGGGDAAELRATEAVRRAGASLVGRVLVLDPGHGRGQPGAVGGGLVEADVVLDLAQRLEGRLAASGVTAVLTRGADQCPDVLTRVRLAEEVGAELFLSIHCDGDVPTSTGASPEALAAAGGGGHGVTTAYWGQAGTGVRSPVGERLADLLQRELVRRTGLLDLRTHPRAFDVLRLTRMPAVRVDVGYLSHPEDAAHLADPAFRDTCAEAMLAAVQRLYLPEEEDAPTGTLFLGDLVAPDASPPGA